MLLLSCIVSLLNNGLILQYGTLQTNITLPISFNSIICIVTGNNKNRSDGGTATYNDISCWSGACLNVTTSTFTNRGSGWFICIGY